MKNSSKVTSEGTGSAGDRATAMKAEGVAHAGGGSRTTKEMEDHLDEATARVHHPRVGVPGLTRALGALAEAECAPTHAKAHREMTSIMAASPHQHLPRPTCVAVVPGANQAVTSGDDMRVILWDLNTRKELGDFQPHTNKAAYVAVAGGCVFSGGFDGKVIVSSLQTQKVVGVFDKHTAPPTAPPGSKPEVYMVAVSSDGKFVLSGTNTGQMLLWEGMTGKVLDTIEDPEPVAGLAFVPPDDKTFICGCGDGMMTLWDISAQGNATQVRQFTHGNSHQVNCVAVTSDGKTMVSASFDMGLLVWDVQTGKEVGRLVGHTDRVWRVAISPNDKRVATASEDGTVRVWDLASRQQTQMFKPGHHGVMGVAFVNDQKIVYTGDGTTPVINVQNLP
jgi:WD40 repeat protein